MGFLESCLAFIYQKNDKITKNEILEITGMKLTSLNRVMHKLLEEKWIVEAGIAESTGGRKPTLYDVDCASGYIFGVNISRIYSNVVIVDMKMNVLSNEKIMMNDQMTPEATAEAIARSIKERSVDLGIDEERILGLGVGTVGPLDREKGIILEVENFFAEGWRNVNIKSLLADRLPLPILVDNGANTAVLAEALYGFGKGYDNIAYFNCGIGIRTGAINNGALIRTMNDAEDAFGHMIIDMNGEVCSCGNKGCIEAYASIPAVVIRFRKEARAGCETVIDKLVGDVKYYDICEAATKGDPLSVALIKDAGEILGTGLANFSNLLNPDLIILSGPLVKASDLFYEISEEAFRNKTYFKNQKKVIFNRGGKFKEDSIAVGAAAMFLEYCLGEG